MAESQLSKIIIDFLGDKMTPEHTDIVSNIILKPTDENLLLLNTVFGLSDDQFRQIVLERNYAEYEASTIIPLECLDAYNDSLVKLINLEEINNDLISSYLEATAALVQYPPVEVRPTEIYSLLALGYRAYRIEQNLSQKELAEKSGAGIGLIGRLEECGKLSTRRNTRTLGKTYLTELFGTQSFEAAAIIYLKTSRQLYPQVFELLRALPAPSDSMLSVDQS